MVILGISGFDSRSPGAALIVDDQVVAACNEPGDHHFVDQLPVQSIRHCLAGFSDSLCTLDHIAMLADPVSFTRRIHTLARRGWKPRHAAQYLFLYQRRLQRFQQQLQQLLSDYRCSASIAQWHQISHVRAYALNALCQCQDTPALVLSFSHRDRFSSLLLAKSEGLTLDTRMTHLQPDSPSALYTTMSQYLGINAQYDSDAMIRLADSGDADRFNLDRLLQAQGKDFRLNNRYVNVSRSQSYAHSYGNAFYSRQLVNWLGLPRTEESSLIPYNHYAATTQRIFEQSILDLFQQHIHNELRTILLAGEHGYNPGLLQRAKARFPDVSILANNYCHTAGAPLQAAAAVAIEQGRRIYFGDPAARSNPADAVLQAAVAHDTHCRAVKDMESEACNVLLEQKAIGWHRGEQTLESRSHGSRVILFLPQKQDHLPALLTQQLRERVCYLFTTDTFARQLATGKPDPGLSIQVGPMAIRKKWQKLFTRFLFRNDYLMVKIFNSTDSETDSTGVQKLLKLIEASGKPPVLMATELRQKDHAICQSPPESIRVCKSLGLHALYIDQFEVRLTTG